jgi:Putative 8-oxoguanine DNA glycosylase OGG-like protein
MATVSATDISRLTLSDAAARWVLTADPAVAIVNHSIKVDLDWWNEALRQRGLPGGPVTGLDEAGDTVASGRCAITRGHVFAQAASAAHNPDAALRLLWHAVAWGSGMKYRQSHKRMDSIAADVDTLGEALTAAARLSLAEPVEAYRCLYPNGRSLIAYVGPAFFTKYLYFAGAGESRHPCVILDSRVAAALVRIGWTSLHTEGGWPASTYARYLDLLGRWSSELGSGRQGGPPRLDLLERCLFNTGPSDQ